MQMEKAEELREKWIKKGNFLCEHVHIEKEYHLGTATGDYVCTSCGQCRWGNDWNKKLVNKSV